MMISATYHRFITWIGEGTGVPDAMLHIHAGMAILLLARVITGRSLGTFIPLSFVVLAEIGNEVMDRLYDGYWRVDDSAADIINTLFWPTIICLAVRLRPLITKHAAGQPAE